MRAKTRVCRHGIRASVKVIDSFGEVYQLMLKRGVFHVEHRMEPLWTEVSHYRTLCQI